MARDLIYVTNGCSNHSCQDRADLDFYATNPVDVERLFNECEGLELSPNILEPCAGEGHIARVLKGHGHNVSCWDIVQRSYPLDWMGDFLSYRGHWDGDIVTNPPYDKALECVPKALSIIPEGRQVVMLLKLTFLEGRKRRALFDTKQLRTLYVFSNRTQCSKNGDPLGFDSRMAAVAYGWFVWQKGYTGGESLHQVD